MNTNNPSFLEMSQAVDVLIEFGDAYSSAAGNGDDPEGELVELTQTLLALLTDRAATRDDVEAVLPFDLEPA